MFAAAHGNGTAKILHRALIRAVAAYIGAHIVMGFFAPVQTKHQVKAIIG